MTSSAGLLLCPVCRTPLPVRPPCSCGFVLRESEGILSLMTPESSAAAQTFLEAYERVRADEQWGGDDLDLPFHPKRHHDIWDIRQRTFLAFQAIAARVERGYAVDVGAGNCWMTRFLDRWGFDAIAIDVNTSSVDGLAAGQRFIDEGSRFLRIRSSMDWLPFASGRIRLLTINAAFHYAVDFRATLGEFKRVLPPGGMIAIMDTPVYENPADGERMVAERVRDFHQKYGIPEVVSRQSRFLTFDSISELAAEHDLGVRVHRTWPGWRRKYEEIRGRLGRRRIAQFPLIVFEKQERK
jgi:SAM-dependent methyltransferase